MSIDWTKVITPTDKFEQARERKVASIQASSNKAIADMTVGYTVGGKESFLQQRRGAEDIIAGVSSVEATYVRSLVDGRVLHGDIELGALEGEAKYLAFAQRIIQNAENAELATVAIVSKQQGHEVRATIEELDEIVW